MRGAFKKDPQRRRKDEPKPHRTLGNPPGRLATDVKKAWRDINRHCVPGVLTIMDRESVEIASIGLARIREKANKYDDDGKPLITMTNLKTVFAMLGKFGMNPSDRAGISILK